jgi:hypothetical protein
MNILLPQEQKPNDEKKEIMESTREVDESSK